MVSARQTRHVRYVCEVRERVATENGKPNMRNADHLQDALKPSPC